jgi:hypothetical protein
MITSWLHPNIFKKLCGTVSFLLLKVETFTSKRLFDFVVFDEKYCANIKN